MVSELSKIILEDFLESSRGIIDKIVEELGRFEREEARKVHFYYRKNNHVNTVILNDEHFFLRSSFEYSNPQLTVEEVQGIIAARLIEVCGNYFDYYEIHEVDKEDVDEMCEMLIQPSSGKIVSFLLNTDDIEPDRYSMNPLKESIVKSGQSAFPSASVKTERLEVDKKFFSKYEGTLISRSEIESIDLHLRNCENNYMNMVDAVKYEQLEYLSESFGINLLLPSMRMPLTVLKEENTHDLLHYIISEGHKDYESIERVYHCMGRSLKKRKTLLTVPHSEKGYGSKRSARGRIYFDGKTIKNVKITYRTTMLYPNSIDPDDISIAKADDKFYVEGTKLSNYSFHETPSSPQFILYSIGSPEDAVIWHGIGAFGASQLVRSYTSTRLACAQDLMLGELKKKYNINTKIPLQLNIIPNKMWVHPIHDNIDASIGCVENLEDLSKMGVKLEYLSTYEYARRYTSN